MLFSAAIQFELLEKFIREHLKFLIIEASELFETHILQEPCVFSCCVET